LRNSEIIVGTINLLVFWSIAASFILVTRYYTKCNIPMPMFIGNTNDLKSISDITAFNKSVSRLIMVYASILFFGGILTFLTDIGFIIAIIVAISILGLIPIGIVYNRILDKYKKIGN